MGDAISKADAAKAEVAKAQTEKQNAAEALKKAKKALANFYPDMKKLMDEFDNGPRQLKEFQESVMADLKVLETLAPPVVEEEPVEEAAAEEPAAVEEATGAA